MNENIVLTVDGVIMPAPSSMSWTLQTFDLDSGRSTDGTMQRTVVCNKEQLSLSWNSANLTPEEISMVLKAVLPTFFKVGYFSPLEGQWIEKQMYVGDRNINFYSFAFEQPIQDSLSFNLIER
ncbi:MAG: hypothetical protein [Malazfec virus 1]